MDTLAASQKFKKLDEENCSQYLKVVKPGFAPLAPVYRVGETPGETPGETDLPVAQQSDGAPKRRHRGRHWQRCLFGAWIQREV